MDENLIEAILANPDHNFTSFLFESDTLSTVELISEIAATPKQGYEVAVQCLSIWQDFQQSEHTLSLITDELQHSNQSNVVIACVKLVTKLIKYAPDPIARIKVRHELQELNFDSHLEAINEKFPDVLDETVDEFKEILLNPPRFVENERNISVVPVREFRPTDADSGTFSSEEEDMSNHDSVSVSTHPDIVNDLHYLISSFNDQSNSIDLLKQLLNHIKTSDQPDKKLQNLTENFESLSTPPTTSSAPPPAPPLPFPTNKNAPPAPPLNLPGAVNVFNPPPLPGNNQNGPPPGPKNTGPPPPPPLGINGKGPPPPPNLKSGPPPPPKSNGVNLNGNAAKKANIDVPQALKPKVLPAEGKKLKHLQWTKIPANGLQNEDNIWLNMGAFGTDLISNLNFQELEDYFEVSETLIEQVQQKEETSKSTLITLLNEKRSLSVNVFLRFSKGIKNLVELLAEGDSEAIGLERLKMLVPLIPTEEECQTLKNFSGDREMLGAAEQFLLVFMEVPYYKIRLDCMILKEEFGGFINTIEPDLEVIIVACNELKNSKNLRKVLYILLHMGNYLNHGAGVGNAVAFKLSSLWKIDELKARKAGRTLLHLVTQEAQRNKILLNDVVHVNDAARIPFESLKADVKASTERVNKLENQIKTRNEGFFNDFRSFLEDSKKRLSTASSLLNNIEDLRKELAIYFCENEKTFSLEECFKIFVNFLTKYKLAANENLQREERQQRALDKAASSSQVPALFGSSSSSSMPNWNTSPTLQRKVNVVESDRTRDSFLTLQTNRRKSTNNKRGSVLENPSSSTLNLPNDLSDFVDQALAIRRPSNSRYNDENRMDKMKEDNETCSEEISVEVPQKELPRTVTSTTTRITPISDTTTSTTTPVLSTKATAVTIPAKPVKAKLSPSSSIEKARISNVTVSRTSSNSTTKPLTPSSRLSSTASSLRTTPTTSTTVSRNPSTASIRKITPATPVSRTPSSNATLRATAGPSTMNRGPPATSTVSRIQSSTGSAYRSPFSTTTTATTSKTGTRSPANLSPKTSTTTRPSTIKRTPSYDKAVKVATAPKATPTTSTPEYSRTVLKRTPITEKNVVDSGDASRMSVRKPQLNRIRTSRQTNDVVPISEKKVVTPLKPSEIRASQLSGSGVGGGDTWRSLGARHNHSEAHGIVPNATGTTGLSTDNPSAARTSVRPVSNLDEITKRLTSPTSARSRPALSNSRVTPITKTPTSANSRSTPNQSKPTSPTSQKKPTFSATERRSLFKHMDSVSTASRPSLIRHGSTVGDKPRWS